MADVGISVKLDGIAAATADLGKLNSKLATTETQTKKTSAAVSGMGGAFGKLRGVMAAVGIGYATRETIKLADAMTNMRSRIQLVVGSTEAAGMRCTWLMRKCKPVARCCSFAIQTKGTANA